MLTRIPEDAARAIVELDDLLRHEAQRLRTAKDPMQHETLMGRVDSLLDARAKAMLERDVYERGDDGNPTA